VLFPIVLRFTMATVRLERLILVERYTNIFTDCCNSYHDFDVSSEGENVVRYILLTKSYRSSSAFETTITT
jgi:hypothetical protein